MLKKMKPWQWVAVIIGMIILYRWYTKNKTIKLPLAMNGSNGDTTMPVGEATPINGGRTLGNVQTFAPQTSSRLVQSGSSIKLIGADAGDYCEVNGQAGQIDQYGNCRIGGWSPPSL